MPSLRDLKVRINSVKSTQKITSAMKMVAASKLRRAQEQAEASRPYAERMERMLGTLASRLAPGSVTNPLIAGTGSDKVHLLIPMTSDRGLCGGFNGSIIRETRRQVRMLRDAGHEVKIITVGRKARDQLRRDMQGVIIDSVMDLGRPRLTYADADGIAKKIMELLSDGQFDVCTIIYNRFQSALTQIVTRQQLIPFAMPSGDNDNEDAETKTDDGGVRGLYEFEPDEEAILDDLLPRNMGVQIFRALQESSASEHGARMTAMDNATRNAGDMIANLTLQYNRSRQAAITKELIEIISGAEAI